MRYLITIILILTGISGFAQTDIRKSSISSGGGSVKVGSMQVVYAVGEVAVQENTQSNIHISEGFIGKDIGVALGVEDFGIMTGVKVYPIPVSDLLNISLSENGNYEYFITNISGEKLVEKTGNELSKKIDLTGLPSGVYLLTIVERGHKKVVSVKIVKK